MEIKVTLRNPFDHSDQIDYYIVPDDHQLSRDWQRALEEILQQRLQLQKSFCFLGFPNSNRDVPYLCEQLNSAIEIINKYDFTQHGLKDYIIEEWFHPNTVRFPEETYPIDQRQLSLKKETPVNEHGDYLPREKLGLRVKHGIMNQLHNHFEVLEGTVENPSPYGQVAPTEVRHAIGELNHLCHELESLILSQRKAKTDPVWVRPSQVMSFNHRKRYELTDEHRQGFLTNGYDREFAHVYMHWTQIGKTLIEVFRDEDAPDLDEATCEAITHLQYYSGEFDVEWAKDVTMKDSWHEMEQLEFQNWLLKHGFDPRDPKLSLGYLHIGQVDLERSFGTEDMLKIWDILSTRLEVCAITINGETYEVD